MATTTSIQLIEAGDTVTIDGADVVLLSVETIRRGTSDGKTGSRQSAGVWLVYNNADGIRLAKRYETTDTIELVSHRTDPQGTYQPDEE